MTKKIAISIPDDVAERLAAGDIDNVSAYVTQALRRQMIVEQTRKMLEDSGISVTRDGIDRWRRILDEKRANTTPEMWQELRDRLDRITSGEESF
jgi:post-segregation antitoxin (ccd killing protein)